MHAAALSAPRTPTRAFTLIELLVVIAIIALLIGILLPALGKARNNARSVISLSNNRQIMVAGFQYRTDTKDQIPMRGTRYFGAAQNGEMESWDSWHFGGKNCDATDSGAFDWSGPATWDEAAYSRFMNPYIYPDVDIQKPSDYINQGTGQNWVFRDGTPTLSDRRRLQMPVFRSPGDRLSYQGNSTNTIRYGQPHPRGVSSYDSVGTSYHVNMKWWDQRSISQIPGTRPRFDEGVRRIRLASENDPSNKFVWVHDQTADLVANANFMNIPPNLPFPPGTPFNARPELPGEFGEPNKSVMSFLDGRAEYLKMVTGTSFDPIPTGNPGRPWTVGRYTFLFVTAGEDLLPD